MNPEQLAKGGSEYAEQCALFAWVNMAKRRGFGYADNMDSYDAPDSACTAAFVPVPELELFHAIKNAGHGDKIRGGRAKAEGVKAGIPDTHLPVCRLGFISLYVEMKRVKKGRLSQDQKDIQALLTLEGNSVWNCKGWREASHVLKWYLT